MRGAASVEHIGLAILIAALLLAAVAAFAAGPPVEDSHGLGTAITRKLRCAPRLPGPCWRDPLTEAYGRPLAGLVRALAPAPSPRSRARGPPPSRGRLPPVSRNRRPHAVPDGPPAGPHPLRLPPLRATAVAVAGGVGSPGLTAR